MIPFPQGAHRLADEKSLPRSIIAALPRTYAVIFYSTDARFGWAMLALNLLVPWVGVAGLAGVLAAGRVVSALVVGEVGGMPVGEEAVAATPGI